MTIEERLLILEKKVEILEKEKSYIEELELSQFGGHDPQTALAAWKRAQTELKQLTQ